MSPTPRGKGVPGDTGIPEQRRTHADHMAHSTTTARTQSARTRFEPRRPRDSAAPTDYLDSVVSPRSPLRVLLVVVAALITVTAVLGALLGINGPVTDAMTDTSPTPGAAEPLDAQLVGSEPVTSTDDSRWLTMLDDAPRTSRPDRSAQSDTKDVPEQGPGEFRVAAAPNGPLPHGAFTYTVEVERNLTFDADTVARLVNATLTDPRSWSTEARPLAHVDTAPAARILLATPETADALCAPLETRGRLSCRNGANVVINVWRWVNGTPGYTNLLDYRRYVINHEVGHALGNAHVECPVPGALAPVMLQQSLGLDGCRPNPWSNPSAGTVN